MPANLPVAFAALLAGGLLLEKGVAASKDAFGAGGTAPAAAAVTSTGHVTSGPEKQQVQQVAARYGLAPQTLWGVYGTESAFGTNPSTSSAGARGPFQFIASTWAQWGHGSIMNFSDSLDAAARYLKSLGASGDPHAPATIAALNAYNGNGGGPSMTSYAQSVIADGGQF